VTTLEGTEYFSVRDDDDDDPVLVHHPSGSDVDTWREGYPYDHRMSRAEYEEQKRLLQIELLKLQKWSQSNGLRHVLVFEGRDAAGKGGTIKRFMEHLNPRGARVVALEKPTDRERTQWYFQRYIKHLPAAGELVLFDRSSYNRARVERVMGYCTPDQHAEFIRQAPLFEQMLVNDGISLTKLWFSVTQSEQRTRFTIRQVDPVRQWKLSPTDLASLDKWGPTPRPRRTCSRSPTPTSRRGRSSRATTRSAPASTPCATSWVSSTTTTKTVRWSL
jgi:polyphosphate kinase 2